MATLSKSQPITDTIEDIGIVDCDAHFTEPSSLWLDRAPASLKGRVPVQQTVNGITAWYLDGEVWASTGGNTIRNGREKILGSHVIQPFDQVDHAAWDVRERLGLLDDMGVDAQILYPNGIGFASNHIFAIEDVAQRTAILQMYNDFFFDVQASSNDRLFPQALLPIWDMDLTIAEMKRLLDKGIRGFTLSDKPEMLGLPELPDPYFVPMWDLFNESGAVANFHIGAGARREELEAMRNMRNLPREEVTGARPIPAVVSTYWHSFGNQRRLAVHATQMYMSNVRIMVNLCMSDLFDRFPNLKIVSAESGIGWVPFILESLEYQVDEMITDPEERSLQLRRPTDYFRDHIYVMFWYEHVGPGKLIEDIGVNNVLVETDVPHPTCLYPGAKEHFAKVMSHLDPHIRRRVLRENAAELYRIPLPDSPQ
jgi:predicted TIM-barrel fold metal-dependent hydrolase